MGTSRTRDQENSPFESKVVIDQAQEIVPTAPLPDPINENIEAVIELHARAEKKVHPHQRAVESVTAFFGRPQFLFTILLIIALWVTPNLLPRRFGIKRFDPPPFDWLERCITLGSFLMTAGVLIKQTRQEKLAEQRSQLNLQLNLLSEKKIAKLIALVEELRSDHPNLKQRHDPEAEAMKQAADPHFVLDALEQNLEKELSQKK